MKKLIFIFVLCFSLSAQSKEMKTLTISTPNSVSYQVEMATTPLQQQVGLMFRSSLPENQGMFFVFPKKEIIHMWMKNTLIPLDMLFIDENNTIVHIHEQAKPMDETIISSKYPVLKVLEINAGQVKKNGLKNGLKIDLK